MKKLLVLLFISFSFNNLLLGSEESVCSSIDEQHEIDESEIAEIQSQLENQESFVITLVNNSSYSVLAYAPDNIAGWRVITRGLQLGYFALTSVEILPGESKEIIVEKGKDLAFYRYSTLQAVSNLKKAAALSSAVASCQISLATLVSSQSIYWPGGRSSIDSNKTIVLADGNLEGKVVIDEIIIEN